MDAAGTPPGLRKDAARNRRRILDAALEVLCEQGVHAPVEEIAKRAGVGVGTLYRRFPDRTELVEAVFLERGHTYLAVAQESLRIPDAWDAFRTYLERLSGLQAKDRVVTDVLTLTAPESPTLRRLRMRLHATQNRLIRAAQRQGSLRADFVPEDMVLLLIANAAIAQATGELAPESRQRFLGLALDALRAGNTTPLPPPPTPRRLIKALARPPVQRRRSSTPPSTS